MLTIFSTLTAYPLIGLFLLTNLAIGFWAYRKSIAGSFEDYALASRSLPTGVLVMTLLGTLLDAGYLTHPYHGYLNVTCRHPYSTVFIHSAHQGLSISASRSETSPCF